jgi:5-methylcytosine-specific restriction endonuclease McrA
MRKYNIERRKKCKIKNAGAKQCLGCKRWFDIKRFPIDKTYNSGRYSRCRTCAKKQKKALPGYYINKRVGYANHAGGRISVARKKAIGIHKLTTIGIRKILEIQQHRCIYCGVKLTSKNLTLDHRLPISRGGTNTIENIDCVCPECNQLKHVQTKEEFLKFLRTYIKRIQAYQCEPKAETKKSARGRD